MKATTFAPAWYENLKNFFFAEETPYGLALVRMFLTSVALIPMIRRFGRVRELFSADGAPQQMSEIFGQGAVFPELPAAFAAGLYGIMIFALICGVFGFCTRMAFFIGTPLYFYFNMLDAVSTMTKYSVMATHMFVILSLSGCGAVWSVDAILKRWKDGPEASTVPPRFPVWPARCIQAMFCFVYFGAAITKIQTQAFFSGEQMRYWMLSNWNYDNPIGEVLATWTPMLLACGYITVVWEITFPFLTWRPLGRFFALGVGILFHIMTWMTLGLYVFPMICISGYLAFLMERDIVAIRRFVHRLQIPTAALGFPRYAIARLVEYRPAAVSTSALWIAGAVLVALASTEADYRIDLYHARSESGLLPLKTMDSESVLAMVNSRRPIREKDKFFSFELGSIMIGGQLGNRSDSFEFGDRIVAQCNVNIPHEDLWVECVVEDDQSRVIDSSGQFVTREKLFATFSYDAGNKLVPGDYWLVLKSSGKEVGRRPFKLTGDPESLPQMGELLTN